MPAVQSDQQAVLEGEDNSPQGSGLASLSASAPDLIITDPEANLAQELQFLQGGGGGLSLIIPAADFVVDSSNRSWFFGFNSSYLYPTSASNYCGIAPVYLPNGSSITVFAAYMYDNDPAGNDVVYLYAKPLGNTTDASAIASIATSIQSTSLQVLADTTIEEPHIINNALYTYHIGVCLWGTSSDLRFYAAQIFYAK